MRILKVTEQVSCFKFCHEQALPDFSKVILDSGDADTKGRVHSSAYKAMTVIEPEKVSMSHHAAL